MIRLHFGDRVVSGDCHRGLDLLGHAQLEVELLSPVTAAERECLSDAELDAGWRLGCQLGCQAYPCRDGLELELDVEAPSREASGSARSRCRLGPAGPRTSPEARSGSA